MHYINLPLDNSNTIPSHTWLREAIPANKISCRHCTYLPLPPPPFSCGQLVQMVLDFSFSCIRKCNFFRCLIGSMVVVSNFQYLFKSAKVKRNVILCSIFNYNGLTSALCFLYPLATSTHLSLVFHPMLKQASIGTIFL